MHEPIGWVLQTFKGFGKASPNGKIFKFYTVFTTDLSLLGFFFPRYQAECSQAAPGLFLFIVT